MILYKPAYNLRNKFYGERKCFNKNPCRKISAGIFIYVKTLFHFNKIIFHIHIGHSFAEIYS